MSELVATPTSVSTLPIPIRPAFAGFGPWLERLRAFGQQPAMRKAMPGIIALGLIGLTALLWAMFATPAQRNLFAGLDDADKGAVVSALDTAGIKYNIDRGSGALSVADKDYYQAKMLLAQQGLPKSAPDGSDAMKDLPLGASRAVEGERLRSAQELDLARTIEAIDSVQTAKVHVAADQPSVFLRDQKPAAASVMLRLRAGRSLSDAQVQAIANLVASSVQGLSADTVSIVDQTGRLLSRAGQDPASAAADRQVALQQQVEAGYQDSLDKLLIPLVGAGNYTAQVHADLDFADVQSTRESYPKDLQAVRTEAGGWTKEGGPDGPAIGIPGALSNTPPPASTVTATPPAGLTPGQPGATPAQPGTTAALEQGRTNENYSRTFEVGREVSVTHAPVGVVKRLSVAVALKDGAGKAKVTPAQIAQVDALVKGAVAYDQQRGDLIAVSARGFAAPDEALAGKWYEASWVPLLARNLSALAIALIVVLGVAKPLLKRRNSGAPADPERKTTSTEIGGQIAAALANRGETPGQVTLDMIEGAPGYAARAALIRNFVSQDPARAALVVRDLIKADAGKPGERNG